MTMTCWSFVWMVVAMKMIISSFITSLKLWFTFFERFGCFAAHTLNALHRLHRVYLLLRCFYETRKNITINRHTLKTRYWFGKFIAMKTITKLYSNITRSEASNAWNNRESGTREKHTHTNTPYKMWNNNYNWFWRCCFAFHDLHTFRVIYILVYPPLATCTVGALSDLFRVRVPHRSVSFSSVIIAFWNRSLSVIVIIIKQPCLWTILFLLLFRFVCIWFLLHALNFFRCYSLCSVWFLLFCALASALAEKTHRSI